MKGLWWQESNGSYNVAPANPANAVLCWDGDKIAYIWRVDWSKEVGFLWTVIGSRNPRINFAAANEAVTKENAIKAVLDYVLAGFKAWTACETTCRCARHP
jgi:hypothetical protein